MASSWRWWGLSSLPEAACSALACGPLKGCPTTWQLLCLGQHASLQHQSADKAESVRWKVPEEDVIVSFAIFYWLEVSDRPSSCSRRGDLTKSLPGGGDHGAHGPGQGVTRECLLHTAVQEILITGAEFSQPWEGRQQR